MQRICNFENIFIGVDIEKNSRFEKYANDRSAVEKLGIFTEKELDYCFKFRKPCQHICARFCAKEAVYKALSQSGMQKLPQLSEIEIYNNEMGVPFVRFLNESFRHIECKLSLSHCSDISVAYVMVFNTKVD